MAGQAKIRLLEPSIPFHTLVKLVKAEVNSKVKISFLIHHWKE